MLGARRTTHDVERDARVTCA